MALAMTACGSAPDASPADTTPSVSSASSALVRSERIAAVVTQTDLVADEPDAATAVDPDLKNAWGLAFSGTGLPWVSDNETGFTTVYNTTTGARVLEVTIPPPRNGEPPSHPTGQLFDPDSAFMGDRFIFATEDGTISGWQGGPAATLRVDNSKSDAIYKGIAKAVANGKPRLYATDFHNGRVDMFDTAYMPIRVRGAFVDPFLPRNYAPFNVYAQGERLFVSYAQQALPEKEDDAAGAGHGFVDVFTPEGRFVQRLISRGALNSPWGMAIAPDGFGNLGGKLLVGNFGDGEVHVYDLDPVGHFLVAIPRGALGSDAKTPLVIDGLWALVFAPNAGSVNSHQLWFTAGPNDEENGLLGHLEVK